MQPFISLALIFFCLFPPVAFARVIEAPVNPIDYQQNPSDIEWKVIDTPHFEIIFPQEISAQALRVANILEKAFPYVTRSLQDVPLKIPLVLQNQSITSNGFVTLAPRRSEFFVTPSTDPELSNTEWLKTLSIHEFRHVVQFQKGRKGFNKALYFILGEVGQALGLAFTAPPWLYEGDAVGIETALTKGGRGRLPMFERDLRALLLSGQKYDYDKAHLGSYRDYIPNHYVYGYFYTTYMRNTYGDMFLSQVFDSSARKSYNPLSFYRAMDQHLAIPGRFEKFYKNVMKDLIKEWSAKQSELKLTSYSLRNPEKKYGWTNYLYPQILGEGKMIALKRGLSHINQFVQIEGKKEKTIFYPGVLVNEFPYKVRNNRLAYTELDLDPRWGYRDFSRLKVYHFKKNKHVLNLPHTKYRLPVLNHQGKRILAVNWDEQQKQSIVVINLKGKEEIALAYDSSKVISSLDWIDEENIVMVVKDSNDLKQIVRLNLKDASELQLVAPTLINFGFITVSEGKILVESPESGIDNIYLLNPLTRQLTVSSFGAYAPTWHSNKLIYNEYTPLGMSIAEKLDAGDSEQKSDASFVPFYEKFSASEKFALLENDYQQKENFSIKDYSQFKNAVNLHSWVLFAPPLSNSLTVQGYSRDILNKLSLSAGYNYNLNEQTSEGFVSAAWSHLYPVFDLRAAYGGRKQEILVRGETFEDKWEEGTAEVGVQLPWQSITGRFNQSFTVRGFAKLIKVAAKKDRDLTEVYDGALFSPGAEFEFNTRSRLSFRDLNPRWGLSLAGHLEEGRDVTGLDQRGSLNSMDSRIYLPGVFLHHSFYHQLAYEKQRDDFYQYESLVRYPRGTRSSLFLSELRKYSGNYALPLFYPEWNWQRYFYLKRVNLNLFYDAINGQRAGQTYRASTAGWEVILDTHFVRIVLPISFGLRGSYGIEGLERENNYDVFLASTLGTF